MKTKIKISPLELYSCFEHYAFQHPKKCCILRDHLTASRPQNLSFTVVLVVGPFGPLVLCFPLIPPSIWGEEHAEA